MEFQALKHLSFMKANIPFPCIKPRLVDSNDQSYCLDCLKFIPVWHGDKPLSDGVCVRTRIENIEITGSRLSRLAKFCLALIFVFGAQLFSGNLFFAQSVNLHVSPTSSERRSEQTRVVCGNVVDNQVEEGIPFADIRIYQDDILIATTATDMEGKFKFTLFNFSVSSSYRMEVEAFGFIDLRKDSIDLGQAFTEFRNLSLEPGFDEMEVIGIIIEEDMINMDASSTTITREEIERMP